MKTNILIILFMIIGIPLLFSQKSLDFKGQKIDDSRIYIIFNGKDFEYFTDKMTEDGKIKLKSNQVFSLQNENSCNLYMKWINPIKYRLTWKDSTYTDMRDQVLHEFAELIISQYGIKQDIIKKKYYEEMSYDKKDHLKIDFYSKECFYIMKTDIPSIIKDIQELYDIQFPSQIHIQDLKNNLSDYNRQMESDEKNIGDSLRKYSGFNSFASDNMEILAYLFYESENIKIVNAKVLLNK